MIGTGGGDCCSCSWSSRARPWASAGNVASLTCWMGALMRHAVTNWNKFIFTRLAKLALWTFSLEGGMRARLSAARRR
jgi:hypothetical protein